MVGFGILLVLGVVGWLTKPDPSIAKSILYVELLLSIGMVVGGIYLFRDGWQKGNVALSVLAVLPAATVLVLALMGAVGASSRSTDARSVTAAPLVADSFGYSSLDRQAFVAGCGGGQRCTCLFESVERKIPHDLFVQEGQTQLKTGSFTPDFTRRLVKIVTNSAC